MPPKSDPPQKRKRPPTGGTVGQAKIGKHTSETENSETERLAQQACRLDRFADFELHLGHVAIAERLSRQAAVLRGFQ